MPILDGYSATKEIRYREGEESHTVVIAMTANALKEDREKCLSVGMDDYLTKPVDMGELEAVIERWMQVSKVAEESEEQEDKEENFNSNLSEANEDINLIDFKRLAAISDGDSEFEMLILQTFVEGATTSLESAKQALQVNDCTTVEHQAHQLKGISANVGIASMQAAANQLEMQARQKNLEGASELLVMLENTLKQVEIFLVNQAEGGS